MPVPSVDSIKYKFGPSFANVDNASIQFAIEEAVVECGPEGTFGEFEWVDDANYTLALMYYAAHLMQVSIMRQQSGTGQVVTSERTPELSVTYGQPPFPSMDKPVDLTMTIYGVRFLALCEKNFPPVAVCGSAVAF
jgi:hypothetical protein